MTWNVRFLRCQVNIGRRCGPPGRKLVVQLPDLLVTARLEVVRLGVVWSSAVVRSAGGRLGQLIDDILTDWIDEVRRNHIALQRHCSNAADKGLCWIVQCNRVRTNRICTEVARALSQTRNIILCGSTRKRLRLPVACFRRSEEGTLQKTILVPKR